MSEWIRIRGAVQGVGFRPTVARIAGSQGLAGFVRNDADGVLIGLASDELGCSNFLSTLLTELPRLARIESIEREPAPVEPLAFQILGSEEGVPNTEVVADATVCSECVSEVLDPAQRRYRYPLTTCTNCGPRFSIATAIPFDRANTTLAGYPLCERCLEEYGDEGDRRFHAQALACPSCGPQVHFEPSSQQGGEQISQQGGEQGGVRVNDEDPIAAAAGRILAGDIVAIKGVGGYQLCCDATNPSAVATLRQRKRRPHKAFAIMVPDLAAAEALGLLNEAERAALSGSAGPIVLLTRRAARENDVSIAEAVAPDQPRLGVMLPTSPLHGLLLAGVGRPIVCTSGNLTSEPQCIDDDDARQRLARVADWFVTHDRAIHSRVDDSVAVHLAGKIRLLRRARGYAPSPLALPPGLEDAPALVAFGADLKATFALAAAGWATLSPHLGDIEELRTYDAYRRALSLASALRRHRPELVVCDAHVGYQSRALAQQFAQAADLRLVEVMHHHAHICACLVDNRWPLDAGPVLGLALDGLGAGPRGELWGGELLHCDYRRFERLGSLGSAPLLGGDAASRMPWRSLYAHLRSAVTWEELETQHANLEVVGCLRSKRTPLMEQVLDDPALSPRASSSGRFFDAVAAALGLAREAAEYEGQAAMLLEALVPPTLEVECLSDSYPLPCRTDADGVWKLGTGAIWRPLLRDLGAGLPRATIAARVFGGVIGGLVQLLRYGRERTGLATVVLSGGCFQNRVLLEGLTRALRSDGFELLLHERVPPHDGCISLGQAAIAAARER